MPSLTAITSMSPDASSLGQSRRIISTSVQIVQPSSLNLAAADLLKSIPLFEFAAPIYFFIAEDVKYSVSEAPVYASMTTCRKESSQNAGAYAASDLFRHTRGRVITDRCLLYLQGHQSLERNGGETFVQSGRAGSRKFRWRLSTSASENSALRKSSFTDSMERTTMFTCCSRASSARTVAMSTSLA